MTKFEKRLNEVFSSEKKVIDENSMNKSQKNEQFKIGDIVTSTVTPMKLIGGFEVDPVSMKLSSREKVLFYLFFLFLYIFSRL